MIEGLIKILTIQKRLIKKSRLLAWKTEIILKQISSLISWQAVFLKRLFENFKSNRRLVEIFLTHSENSISWKRVQINLCNSYKCVHTYENIFRIYFLYINKNSIFKIYKWIT